MTRPIRSTRRDRLALAHRIVGAASGFALVVWAFASSSWDSPWTIALFAVIVIGGVASYHGLTSVLSCPGCGHRVTNFRITSAGARRKLFRCRRCGALAYLTEGFYWQRDWAG